MICLILLHFHKTTSPAAGKISKPAAQKSTQQQPLLASGLLRLLASWPLDSSASPAAKIPKPAAQKTQQQQQQAVQAASTNASTKHQAPSTKHQTEQAGNR
jgi:hypothetical protein